MGAKAWPGPGGREGIWSGFSHVTTPPCQGVLVWDVRAVCWPEHSQFLLPPLPPPPAHLP